MKKNPVREFLFRAMMLATVALTATVIVACSDDDDAAQVADSDIVEIVDEPTVDVVTSHIDRTAYIVDGLITANSERTMVDNFLNRYARTVPFRDLQSIVPGDAVAFDVTALNGLLGDAATVEKIKAAFGSGAVLLMSGGTKSDFTRLCDTLDCYNPYAEMEETAAADGEKLLWVLSGELPGVGGIYAVLSPYSSSPDSVMTTLVEGSGGAGVEASEVESAEPGLVSEYYQGQLCEQLTEGINRSLTAKAKAQANADQPELTNLMSATKVYLTDSFRWKYKQKIRTGYYTIEMDIWNAYSEAEKKQYYLIHQEMTFSMKDYCVGSFHNGSMKTYGMYGKYYETTFRNVTKPGAVTFHRLAPSTTQTSTSYTSTVGFNLGGSVSTKGGAGISGGINISHSEAYTVEDVSIYNNSVATSKASNASWLFDMRDPSPTFNWKSHASIDFRPCSASGRSTCICGTDYIFSVPNGTSNNWRLDLSITNRFVTGSYVMGIKELYYDDQIITGNKNFSLPVVSVN